MEQPRSASRYILVALCVVIVFTALVLVAMNAWMKQPGNPIATTDRYQEGYSKGYSDARERLRSAGLLSAPSETNILNGTVLSVGNGSIVVKQTNLDTDPTVDQVPDERTITITSSTKIYQRVLKDPAVLDTELREFEKSGASGSAVPDPYIQTVINFSEIPVGAKVFLYSNMNVRLLSDIVATEIYMVK
jgi:hypothetical protein